MIFRAVSGNQDGLKIPFSAFYLSLPSTVVCTQLSGTWVKVS